MAKIKFGMMMTDARNKLGGQVFSKNRSGSYVRTKVTPVNPQTVFQSLVRSLFASISQAWSNLTAAQIAAWNNAVDDWQTTDIFGDSIKPSGKNLHQRLNQNAQLAGYSAITTPPTKEEVPDDVVTAVDIDPGTGDAITLTGAYTGADATVVLEATPPLSAGTTFAKNRLVQIYRETGDNYDGAAAMAAYEARFGEPADGANVFVAVKYVLDTGQTSVRQILKADVSAT